MSLKYRDHNGVSRVISGITPGGDLEYGAVATRSGTITVELTPNQNYTQSVTFSNPMPDADYEVTCSTAQTGGIAFIPMAKTANGFMFNAINLNSSNVTHTFEWTAFKLYTVADAEQLYSTVQDIEAMIPSSASSTNKFATASDLRTESRALDRRLDDVEDVIPTSATIANKLVTQSDLSGVEIDKVEDINDVELTDIQDGQTLIWDDSTSKWVNGQGGKTYSAGNGINISGTDEISTNTDNTSVVIGNNKELKVADTYKTTFIGTTAAWNALSAADKAKYSLVSLTDDAYGASSVTDAVTDGDMRPVTSNAVYDGLATKVNTSSIVDAITNGNMNPVTSNAVYDRIADLTYYAKRSIALDSSATPFASLTTVDVQLGLLHIITFVAVLKTSQAFGDTKVATLPFSITANTYFSMSCWKSDAGMMGYIKSNGEIYMAGYNISTANAFELRGSCIVTTSTVYKG